jgi:hypothetical protein
MRMTRPSALVAIYAVADAGESDAEPLAVDPLSLSRLLGLQARSMQAFREQADERAGEHEHQQLRRRCGV